MKSLTIIRNRCLSLSAALLILAQSLLAVGAPVPYEVAPEKFSKAELQQGFSAKVSYVEAATRITLATFLFYWIVKAFALLDVLIIRYQNCQAFYVNPHSFHTYYTYLSGLAP